MSASEKGLTEDEGALLQAIRPLVTNPDCHFLAVLTALVQSILEGRTDCPISGVFGAGKTRSAAAMIAGLMSWWSPKRMQRHMPSPSTLSLYSYPPSLEAKFGRLVGATELEKGPASKTRLDVPPGYRNDVLRGKQVIIGCAGGFHQNVHSHTVQLPGGWRRWTWPSMMRASSTGTLMNPQLLHGFPAKGLLYGVETTSKHREDCARVRKPGLLDAS